MSTKVAPAPANDAKQPVRSEKPAKESENQHAAKDEDIRPSGDDSDQDVRIADSEDVLEVEQHEESLAGDFTFGEALAEAAASSGSLITEAEDTEVSFDANYGGGSQGTILLIGAVILVGLGIAALASGGNNGEDTPLNEDPTITTDVASITVVEDSTAGAAVVATTTDPDGDTVTVTSSDPTGGTVTKSGNTFTFVPDADFSGSTSFVLTASDGNGGTATKTINVTVTGVNDDPVFAQDAVAISTDENVVFNGDLDGTATDADGDDLTFSLDTQATNGTAVVNADGTYSYTPDTNFFGTDSYVVKVSDGNGGTDTMVVNVTVVDDPNTGPVVITESIDVGTTSTVVAFDAGDGDYNFTDSRDEITNVVINNFGEGDVITVTGASPDDYSFGTQGDALEIVFNNSPDFTRIIINLEDPLVIDGLVFDYDSAVAALGGYDFINFG